MQEVEFSNGFLDPVTQIIPLVKCLYSYSQLNISKIFSFSMGCFNTAQGRINFPLSLEVDYGGGGISILLLWKLLPLVFKYIWILVNLNVVKLLINLIRGKGYFSSLNKFTQTPFSPFLCREYLQLYNDSVTVKIKIL